MGMPLVAKCTHPFQSILMLRVSIEACQRVK